ncbi:MAG: hypothetical protein ACRDBG_20915 [Waterburya sp.]
MKIFKIESVGRSPFKIVFDNISFVIMAVSIHYNLTGRGWSECIVEIDEQQIHLTASYLSDALADLLDAVTSILRGANEATASFTEEPGEYRWRFTRLSKDRLCVCILWFDETWSHKLDRDGKVILEAECKLQTFARAILSASQQVLAVNGLEGYQEKWVNYEFPVRLLAKLKKALD